MRLETPTWVEPRSSRSGFPDPSPARYLEPKKWQQGQDLGGVSRIGREESCPAVVRFGLASSGMVWKEEVNPTLAVPGAVPIMWNPVTGSCRPGTSFGLIGMRTHWRLIPKKGSLAMAGSGHGRTRQQLFESDARG